MINFMKKLLSVKTILTVCFFLFAVSLFAQDTTHTPATQARDLLLLDEKYVVTKVQPVDMFPHTHHIENVVQMKLKS